MSVVTPCLNGARFIGETVDSVRSQAGGSVEHVVVDGGSSDGTLEILARAGDGLRVVSEKGLRQAAAVNHGWLLSKGEILGWLNADDTYYPGAVERVVGHFAAHPETDALFGDCDYVDEAGVFLRRYPAGPYDLERALASVENGVPQPTVFLRRSLFERVGGLDESLDYALDFDYWLRIAAAGGRLQYLPVLLGRLRLHPGVKSLRGLEHFAQELPRIYARFFSRGDLPEHLRRLRRRSMSRVEERGAQCLFWAGRFSEARSAARRAWILAPWRVRPLVYALGGPARRIWERLSGNPFRLGLRSRE